MRELRVWFALNHPNILPLRGFILEPPSSLFPWFVTDWMDSGTLKEYYEKNKDGMDKFALVCNNT